MNKKFLYASAFLGILVVSGLIVWYLSPRNDALPDSFDNTNYPVEENKIVFEHGNVFRKEGRKLPDSMSMDGFIVLPPTSDLISSMESRDETSRIDNVKYRVYMTMDEVLEFLKTEILNKGWTDNKVDNNYIEAKLGTYELFIIIESEDKSSQIVSLTLVYPN